MNKVEKIKAEIEKRISAWKESSEIGELLYFSEICVAESLLSFIDSLSEEKVSDSTPIDIPFGAADSELMEETIYIPQGYHAVIDGNKVIIKKGEEPVSNNLEEAAHSYVDTTIEWFDSEGNPCCYPAFIAGAQWQKKQTVKWLKENKDHPFIKCEDPCLSGYLTDEFIEEFKKAMEE